MVPRHWIFDNPNKAQILWYILDNKSSGKAIAAVTFYGAVVERTNHLRILRIWKNTHGNSTQEERKKERKSERARERERERERSKSKTLIFKDSSIRSDWTYLTASPCYSTDIQRTNTEYYNYLPTHMCCRIINQMLIAYISYITHGTNYMQTLS